MLIKKLFGDYSRFVKFIKRFLIFLALIIILYVILLILFGNNLGKIKLSKLNTTENSRPYLTILNSSVDGIYFGKYKYHILSNQTEKDHNGNYILLDINARIISKKDNIRITSNKAAYSEKNQVASINENIKIYYLNAIGYSEEIVIDFTKDIFFSDVKCSANSEDYYFEAPNGFKSDHIDFSHLDFFGPISLDIKKKKSNIVSDNAALFVTQKDKKLIRAEFRSNVKFKNEKFDVKSDKADYLKDKEQFVFYDNLTINSENKKLVGDIFIYDIKKDLGYVRTKEQHNKRVEMYFNDKKK